MKKRTRVSFLLPNPNDTKHQDSCQESDADDKSGTFDIDALRREWRLVLLLVCVSSLWLMIHIMTTSRNSNIVESGEISVKTVQTSLGLKAPPKFSFMCADVGFRSQFREDQWFANVWLRQHLKFDGTAVEIGAYDGVGRRYERVHNVLCVFNFVALTMYVCICVCVVCVWDVYENVRVCHVAIHGG